MNDLLDGLAIDPRSDLFVGITKDKQSDIFNAGEKRLIPPGETLFREGEPAFRCYVVQKGRLKLTKLHEEGKEAIVRYINPGDITAAVAVFAGKRYPVTATAIGPTEVVGWNRETILKLLSTHPALAINLLQAAVERLDDVQTRYLELQAERVERRIAHAVLRIMRQSGRRMDAGILIDFPLSRQDLADYTGTTLYTVSRTLSRWEKLDWISTGREKIVVTDPHALVTFAETG
jgi:CRP/FNR family transcriptional regulator, nitrogen oxide reductase regulator